MTMLVFSSDDSGCDSFLLFLVVDVTTTISCRDLTVLPFVEIYVATSISCCDLAVLLSTAFCVATSKACRDTIYVFNH